MTDEKFIQIAIEREDELEGCTIYALTNLGRIFVRSFRLGVGWDSWSYLETPVFSKFPPRFGESEKPKK
jgi:hypothetical protein